MADVTGICVEGVSLNFTKSERRDDVIAEIEDLAFDDRICVTWRVRDEDEDQIEKAVEILRKPWYHGLQERTVTVDGDEMDVKRESHVCVALFCNETTEQKRARLLRDLDECQARMAKLDAELAALDSVPL